MKKVLTTTVFKNGEAENEGEDAMTFEEFIESLCNNPSSSKTEWWLKGICCDWFVIDYKLAAQIHADGIEQVCLRLATAREVFTEIGRQEVYREIYPRLQ
ncbi:MAG: hypothetical protein FWD61_11530 [Phycisphaerales bacterium]|nr:hypothetical protein [Phycisphaerales bacterium]